MENFIVSARKYRPSTWDTVIGQLSITSTLQNAIQNNHLAQAYLFCGPRGVGKTTCARIFARVINGANEGDDLSYNIFELDAASNNSVDDIRNLTDQVRVPPQTGRYKVYIIDEVHMLSQAAFNAFLKTLEEPPPHAIFILATTEKHKIIPTILSRCQIFDFNRILVDDIASYLGTIAGKEGITAEPDALHIIAQKADGAMRDALSIFDQIVSFAGNNLTYEAVIQNLNILDYDYYFKATDHILNENIPASLLIFDEVLSHGFDGHNFINGLAEHLRNLLVCKDPTTVSLLEVGESIRQRYQEQARQTDANLLIKGLNILAQGDVQYKASKNQRLLVELTLMQLCSMNGEEKKNDDRVAILPPGHEPKSAPEPPQPIAINRTIDTEKSLTDREAVQKPKTENTPEPEPEVTEATDNTTDHELPETVEVDEVASEPEVMETPRPVKKIGSPIILKTSTISISKIIAPQVKTQSSGEAQDENDALPAERFDELEFTRVWKAYAEQMKDAGKDVLYSTLSKREPVLKGTRIELIIDNKVQEQMVAQEKATIMEYLRTELNNFELTLETKMTEVEDSVHLYTNKEKFMRMAEKNPALLKLRENLDLDIEY